MPGRYAESPLESWTENSSVTEQSTTSMAVTRIGEQREDVYLTFPMLESLMYYQAPASD